MFKKLIATIFFVMITIGVAQAESRFDGAWYIKVYNSCDKTQHTVVITIKDAQLASDEIVLDIQGKIKDNGDTNIIASSKGKVFYSIGRFSHSTGVGVWQSDECSGSWKAERK